MNILIIKGNLTKDPQTRTSDAGNMITRFSLACNMGKEDVEYFNVECYGAIAENAAKYLSKGSSVLVSGRLITRKWTDKDNNPHTYQVCVANTVEYISTKKNNESNASADGFMNVPQGIDEALPFN